MHEDEAIKAISGRANEGLTGLLDKSKVMFLHLDHFSNIHISAIAERSTYFLVGQPGVCARLSSYVGRLACCWVLALKVSRYRPDR